MFHQINGFYFNTPIVVRKPPSMVQEITAQELEAACRKCILLTVTDSRAMCTVLDALGLEYQLLSDTEAEIYGQPTVTELVQALAERGCSVLSIREQEEGLENYFMNLIGAQPDESQVYKQ